MVIECIGLPGSGKTYLMELVEKELRRREVDYVNVSANLMNRITWKILRKAARALIYLDADARWLRDRLVKILDEEGERSSSFGIYENERYTVKSAALLAFLYRRMIWSPKLYLFDEGLVHTLIKFCADFKISEETFRKMVTESERGLRSTRLVIYTEISMEDCLASIEKRDRHVCAFDALTGDALTGLLAEYDRLNKAYSDNHPVLKIRREDENRTKLARVFGKIRRILAGT